MPSSQGLAQSKILHAEDIEYGFKEAYKMNSSIKSMLNIANAIQLTNKTNLKIKSVLDFGCGKGGLLELLSEELDDSINIQGYDPGLEKFKQKPKTTFSLTTCIEVLEHIDRSNVLNVLNEIDAMTSGILFYVIDLIPARKKLSDGRNAHIMLAPHDWWNQQISSVFSMNFSFVKGEMPDGSPYPIRLLGCATNYHLLLEQISLFLIGTGLAKKKWILSNENRELEIKLKHLS